MPSFTFLETVILLSVTHVFAFPKTVTVTHVIDIIDLYPWHLVQLSFCNIKILYTTNPLAELGMH